MQDLMKIAELIDRARSNIKEHRESTTDQLSELFQVTKDIDQALLYVEKEITDLDIQIGHRKTEKTEAKRSIKETEKKNAALQKEGERLQTKVDELRNQTKNNEIELAGIQKTWVKVDKQLAQRRSKQEEIANRVQALEKQISGARETNEKTIGGKRTEREATEQALKKLKEENVVIDYILNEGVRDAPEVEFLALLIRETEVTLSALRKQSKLTAKAAEKLVETLQTKGVISVQTDGTIRFLKPM